MSRRRDLRVVTLARPGRASRPRRRRRPPGCASRCASRSRSDGAARRPAAAAALDRRHRPSRASRSATSPKTQQVFGIDVDGLEARARRPSIDASVARLSGRAAWRDVPPGDVPRPGAAPPLRDLPPRRRPRRQAADGPRRGPAVEPRAGQPLQHAARRSRSTRRSARRSAIDARPGDPADPDPPDDTKYIKHEQIQSERLTKFWGRPMYLGAHVLLPEGFDDASRRALSAGDQPRPLPARLRRLPRGAARSEPEARLLASASTSTATTASSRSRRYQFYKDWTGPELPARADRRDPARQPVLRRLLRGELRRTSAPTATRSRTS